MSGNASDLDAIRALAGTLADKLHKPPLSYNEQVMYLVLYITIIVFAVAGNAVVIMVVLANKAMRTVTNTLLTSLAISDMLIALLNMPVNLLNYIQNEWTLGEFMCKFCPYMQAVTIVASILTLTGIAIDRYYAICHPLKARHVHTMQRAVLLVACFWISAFIIMLPQAFIQTLDTRVDLVIGVNGSSLSFPYVCVEELQLEWERVLFTLTYYFLLYIVPMFIMIIAYGKIAHRLWIRKPVGVENAKRQDTHVKQKKKIIRMLVCVVFFFMVCWTPYFVAMWYLQFNTDVSTDTRRLVAVLQLIGYSNTVINPVVYTFLNDTFKVYFKKTFGCCCKDKVEQTPVKKFKNNHSSTTNSAI